MGAEGGWEGCRADPKYTRTPYKHPQKLMAWCAISASGKRVIHFVGENKTMTSAWYVSTLEKSGTVNLRTVLPGQIMEEITHIFDQFDAWKILWKYRDLLHHIEISWNIVCIVKKTVLLKSVCDLCNSMPERVHDVIANNDFPFGY